MATSTTYLSLIKPELADTTKIREDFNTNMDTLDGRFSAVYMAVQAKNAVTITGGSITGITDLAIADGGTGSTTAANARTALSVASRALDNISSCAINAALLLGTSNAYALGSTTYMWSDLFLASGAVINFNNGDVTLTHSSNTLTLGGGTFVVSRASETTATNASWFTLGSTVATGDLTGLRTVITSNAASGGGSATGVNVRGVYGQAVCTANKHAGLLQGGLFTAGAAAGTVYNIHVLCGHYSSGGATTIGGDLYVGYLRAQTRQSGRSVTGNDCLLALENEAVSGTGQIMDSAIRIFDTNMGVDGFTYGIDMSSADIATADIILQNSETISNTTDGIVAISGTLALSTNSITMSGSIGVTGTRVTKLWTADLECTNDITINGTALASIYANLGANTDITSLTGLTTALGAAYGGTGVANNADSTLTISGNFATTLTVTNTTGITLPTSGTLATTSNKLSAFAATTSAELAGVISNETGSGALVFGTAPSITTINLTGGQIAFPASQSASANANTLDDYEEETWTMGISFGGGTTGITYVVNTGYYTKIGNIVTISGQVSLSSKGTSTGDAYLTGLPFTVVDNIAGRAAVLLMFVNVTFAEQYQGRVVENTNTIVFYEITEAGAATTLTDANFANDSSIIVGCTYRVD